jgi:Asp/Glu/hydantoin racemase
MKAPHIALIHALKESQVPIWDAFAAQWPEARTTNLLDDSLSEDLAAEGELSAEMMGRFLTLGRYAARNGADAILFTCSAFGLAIAAVKQDLKIPVLTPNEAAFEETVSYGSHIGLLVTFPPSLGTLQAELESAQPDVRADARLVAGALTALQAGDAITHDRLIGATVADMKDCDAIVLGQFSMARAARGHTGAPPLLTTPGSAVTKLRRLLAA